MDRKKKISLFLVIVFVLGLLGNIMTGLPKGDKVMAHSGGTFDGSSYFIPGNDSSVSDYKVYKETYEIK